jgi:hypothetical protein
VGGGHIPHGDRVVVRPQSDDNLEEEGDNAVPPQPSHHEDKIAATFGPNEWLVDELYEQFLADKNAVDQPLVGSEDGTHSTDRL